MSDSTATALPPPAQPSVLAPAPSNSQSVVGPPEVEGRTLAQCELVIESGRQTFIDVGNALKEIRDSGLYREVAGTFVDYCRTRWNFGKSRAYQLIEAAAETSTTVDKGNPTSQTPPQNERQARMAITERKAKSKPAPAPLVFDSTADEPAHFDASIFDNSIIDDLVGKVARALDDKAASVGGQGPRHAACLDSLNAFVVDWKNWKRASKDSK